MGEREVERGRERAREDVKHTAHNTEYNTRYNTQYVLYRSHLPFAEEPKHPGVEVFEGRLVDLHFKL